MKKFNLLTSIALSFVILTSTISTSWADSDRQEMAMVKSIIEKSGVTAKQAINKVLQDYKGEIYSYELDEKNDVYFHEIKLIDIEADKKIKLIISITNGEIFEKEEERLFSWFFDDDHIVTAKKLTTMKYSILDAIDAIKLDNSSLLQEVEVEDKQGVLFFELETIGDDGEKDWLVDAYNNQLIPVFKK